MLIRPLSRPDLPAVSQITHRAFSHDELFTWLYPHQDKYPDDLRRYQLIRLRTRLVQKGSHGFVAESEEGDAEWSGKPEILGFAFYIRGGRDEKAERWREDGWFEKLERSLLSWEIWYEETFLAHASSPANLRLFRQASDYKFYSLLPSYWHLGLLGIDPKFQRRGIGAKLVRFGQDIAREEQVPVTLEASVMGRGLYAKLGFLVVEESAIVEGLDGVAMVWEPVGREGRWLVRGERGKGEVKMGLKVM